MASMKPKPKERVAKTTNPVLLGSGKPIATPKRRNKGTAAKKSSSVPAKNTGGLTAARNKASVGTTKSKGWKQGKRTI